MSVFVRFVPMVNHHQPWRVWIIACSVRQAPFGQALPLSRSEEQFHLVHHVRVCVLV